MKQIRETTTKVKVLTVTTLLPFINHEIQIGENRRVQQMPGFISSLMTNLLID